MSEVLVAGLWKKKLSPNAMHDLWEIVCWSLQILVSGQWPEGLERKSLPKQHDGEGAKWQSFGRTMESICCGLGP
eukprot:3667423-Amphidinium_carterae.3